MDQEVAEILQNSARINVMRRRIHETVSMRGSSESARQAWQDACQDMHKHYGALAFPGGGAALMLVYKKSPEIKHKAILFLKADPYHFRSGYLKQRIWRMLPNMPLSEMERQALMGVSLQYLHSRIRVEFWYMCRAMGRIASMDFWDQANVLTRSTDPLIAARASWLHAYREGNAYGESVRREVGSRVLMSRYRERRGNHEY